MRLRRSDTDTPGIRRVRRGRGFRYYHPDGSPVNDPEITSRVEDLVIPPAWRKVWICPQPNGHIQAIGTDDAGRRQYLYHPEWRRARDEEKHDRVLALARKLPDFRAAIAADMEGSGPDRNRVLAAALRILDLGIFRTGGEQYAEENGTRGVATLLREHVTVRGSELTFSYPAKGGIHREIRIRDERLAKVITTLQHSRTGTDRVLAYRVGSTWHEVHADDVNERFKELTGDEFTGKDLRTWNATMLAAAAFADHDLPTSKRGLKRVETSVMREVSEELGNTPTVARKSYVDPRVIRAFENGRTIRAALNRARKQRLVDDDLRCAIERAVVRLLTRKR